MLAATARERILSGAALGTCLPAGRVAVATAPSQGRETVVSLAAAHAHRRAVSGAAAKRGVALFGLVSPRASYLTVLQRAVPSCPTRASEYS
jgi:hypothetical protein